MKKIPEHGSCFVCGKANPNSIGVEWYLDDDKKLKQISSSPVNTKALLVMSMEVQPQQY